MKNQRSTDRDPGPVATGWDATDYHFANQEILNMASQDNFDMNVGGVKLDAGKARMDLVPPEAILAVAAVFTYGALKYDDWNWAKGMRSGRIVAALMRHTTAYMMGQYLDPESGLPHTWHMGCCVFMLIGADLRGVLEDDRAQNIAAYEAFVERFAKMNDPRGAFPPEASADYDEPEFDFTPLMTITLGSDGSFDIEKLTESMAEIFDSEVVKDEPMPTCGCDECRAKRGETGLDGPDEGDVEISHRPMDIAALIHFANVQPGDLVRLASPFRMLPDDAAEEQRGMIVPVTEVNAKSEVIMSGTPLYASPAIMSKAENSASWSRSVWTDVLMQVVDKNDIGTLSELKKRGLLEAGAKIELLTNDADFDGYHCFGDRYDVTQMTALSVITTRDPEHIKTDAGKGVSGTVHWRFKGRVDPVFRIVR